jgi:hypothetical protein
MSTPNDRDALAKAAATPPKPSALAKAAAATDDTRDALWAVRQRALDYLNSVWKGSKVCPICQTDDSWVLTNIALLPVRSGEVGTPQEASAYPLAPVSCTVCGYTFFLHEHWVREQGTPEYVRQEMEP